jgi:hypothetical protein
MSIEKVSILPAILIATGIVYGAERVAYVSSPEAKVKSCVSVIEQNQDAIEWSYAHDEKERCKVCAGLMLQGKL